ncbi:alpha/beta hydrolase [Tumidithrix helvetica PCC 7403]|uniref:alpha/beta hydrolase n=1 Tax=Tumidithrix helvetica TaxID=3457545 RepID=UPI003CB9E036
MNPENLLRLLKVFVFPVLRIAVLVYIGLLVALYFGQAKMVFMPRTDLTATPKDLGLAFEQVRLSTKDNLGLSAWFVPANEKDPIGKAVILFCHGNAGNIGDRTPYLPIFHSLGLSTLLFDYQGYGSSEGSPTEAGTYADVEAAWQYLTQVRKIPASKIVIYGESLGGGVASYMVEKQRSGGLVLASTFTSISDRAAELYPFLPIRLISKFSYNTIARLPNIKSPVLVIHSPEDELIPFHHGEALFKAAHDPKMFIKIKGDHNGGFLEAQEIYSAGLEKLVKQYIS